jgi:hypothetical protein
MKKRTVITTEKREVWVIRRPPEGVKERDRNNTDGSEPPDYSPVRTDEISEGEDAPPEG